MSDKYLILFATFFRRLFRSQSETNENVDQCRGELLFVPLRASKASLSRLSFIAENSFGISRRRNIFLLAAVRANQTLLLSEENHSEAT